MWRRDRAPRIAIDFAPRRAHRSRQIVLVALTTAILFVIVVGVTQLLLR